MSAGLSPKLSLSAGRPTPVVRDQPPQNAPTEKVAVFREIAFLGTLAAATGCTAALVSAFEEFESARPASDSIATSPTPESHAAVL